MNTVLRCAYCHQFFISRSKPAKRFSSGTGYCSRDCEHKGRTGRGQLVKLFPNNAVRELTPEEERGIRAAAIKEAWADPREKEGEDADRSSL